MIKVFEQFIQGKHDAASCEDGIVVTDNFVAVIDGSTSKGKKRVNPSMRNGRYCMELIAAFIREIPADITLDAFCEKVTARVHKAYIEAGVTDETDANGPIQPRDRLCASAIVYSNQRKEIWMIGDCQCIAGGKLFTNGKPSEADISEKRAQLFSIEAATHDDMIVNGSLAHDYSRDAILPELVASMEGENRTYAVIDGYPIFKNGVKIIRLNDLPKTDSNVVLASDGYPYLCATLEKSERKLQEQLSTDPFNIHTFKATKGLMQGNVSFDDRAYIRFSTAPAQRYFLTLSFDGTAYHGWQVQPNGITVQERIQDALTKILRHKTEVTGAGRTDAGVHARTMVCHFDDAAGLDCQQLLYCLNQMLPQDIACHKLEPVSSDLHARFSATRRTYRYFIHTSKDPFLRHFSVETHYPLDFPLMNEAAASLLHVTDFKAFCKADNDSKTTVCHLTKAQWIQTSPFEWYFEISADRFLRNMVRAVAGTLFDVGRHRISLQAFKEIVAHGNRSESGESMPAKGLFLWEVEY